METDDTNYEESVVVSATQLRGKQSVRATFRLTDQMIELLKVAANHLEVQQKSLIDELVQSRENLDRVIHQSRTTSHQDQERRQKTLVLSRRSLALLEDVSEKYDLSRDHLVELCISRLIPFVDAEQQKHEQRRQLITEVDQLLDNSKTLLQDADTALGVDDRFRIKLENIVGHMERNIEELRQYVKDIETLKF